MAHVNKWVIPAVAMAGWTASLFLLEDITEDGNAQAWLFGALTLAAGLVAGRWWVLLVPVALGVGIIAYDLLFPCEDCRDEIGPLGAAIFLTLYVAFVDFILAAGVAIRRGGGLWWARRGGAA